MTGQSTVLHKNKHLTEKINIFTGIFQDSRPSPVLFLLYNTPLLEEVEKEKNISATGVLDYIAILVEGKSCKDNSTVILNHHDKICKPWAQLHKSKFTPEKYQLSHFMIKKTANLKSHLSFPEQNVQPQKMIINIGVLLDTKLSWNKQVIANKAKEFKSIGGLAGSARSVLIAKIPKMQKMLHSIVILKLNYHVRCGKHPM